MRKFGATHDRRPVVRRMRWDDLPEILRLAARTPTPPWIRPDFLSVLQSSETVGCVAVVHERIGGFALCSVTDPPRRSEAATILQKLFGWLRGGGRRRCLELFGLGLAPDCPRAEVEPALLEAIVRDCGESAQMIQAVVPETSVPAQAFLRGVGFRAIRIFRSYYGREDGYLMRRDGARQPLRNRPKRKEGGDTPLVDDAGVGQG